MKPLIRTLSRIVALRFSWPASERQITLPRPTRRSFVKPLLLGAGMLMISGVALSASSLASAIDLSVQGKVSFVWPSFNSATRTINVTLYIHNLTSQNIATPYTVSVSALPPGVILTNATAVSSEGIPLITVNSGPSIPSYSKTAIVLKFLNRTNTSFKQPTLRLVRLRQPMSDIERLQGPDADGNGVRDDLEPMLDERYRNNPALRAPAIQVLKSFRNVLSGTSSVESAFQSGLTLNKSMDCMERSSNLEKGFEEIEFLEAQMMNTKERVKAYIDSFNMLAGQVIPGRFKNPCETQ